VSGISPVCAGGVTHDSDRAVSYSDTVASRRAGVIVVGLTLVIAACGSHANHAGSIPPSTTTSTVGQSSSGSPLAFREALGEVPYGTTTAHTASSCNGGRLVTAVAKQTPKADIVLADRQKSSCYLLGPTLLTDQDVGSADAVLDPTTSAWTVNVHFNDDNFAQKVASVEVGKQVAIILDGVVQSSPTVNQGIAGRDVTIAGDFDEATARRIAVRIDPASASRTPQTPGA